jgi:hypothetical protein
LFFFADKFHAVLNVQSQAKGITLSSLNVLTKLIRHMRSTFKQMYNVQSFVQESFVKTSCLACACTDAWARRRIKRSYMTCLAVSTNYNLIRLMLCTCSVNMWGCLASSSVHEVSVSVLLNIFWENSAFLFTFQQAKLRWTLQSTD